MQCVEAGHAIKSKASLYGHPNCFIRYSSTVFLYCFETLLKGRRYSYGTIQSNCRYCEKLAGDEDVAARLDERRLNPVLGELKIGLSR